MVGGALRERLHDGAVRRRPDPHVATSADPDAVAVLFPTARWLNRFGTVTVPGTPLVEVTAFRTEGPYRDRRRPGRGALRAARAPARRDFTINAMAWQPADLDAGHGGLVDPFGGRADLEAGGILRGGRRSSKPGSRKTRCGSSAARASPPAWACASTRRPRPPSAPSRRR